VKLKRDRFLCPDLVVENRGLEPLTPALQRQCSTN
jgi:hypothetical protein